MISFCILHGQETENISLTRYENILIVLKAVIIEAEDTLVRICIKKKTVLTVMIIGSHCFAQTNFIR